MKNTCSTFTILLIGGMLLSVFLAVPPAGAAQINVNQLLTNHVVAANKDGMAISPLKSKKEQLLNAQAFTNYVHQILDQAETWSGAKTNATIPVRLLIYVHGGLNVADATTERVTDFAGKIMTDSESDRYYPIFVRWPSGFLTTYGEHLTSVRQGNKSHRWWGWATSPFIFGSDVFMSIAHTPMDWYYQFINTKDRLATYKTWSYPLISRNWVTAITNSKEATNYNYELIYRQTGYQGDGIKVLPLDLLEWPIRSTIGTLGQGFIAKAGWENMKRRTSNLIHPAPAFTNYTTAQSHQAACAGKFFQLVCNRATSSQYNYQIVLVGHSMGAIVLNKVLTEYRDDWTKKPIIKEIVYMAAADTVNNTVNALVPLIQSYQANTNDLILKNGTRRGVLRFHNLTLNRVAEIAELERKEMPWGLAPHGSLLEWIDQHLETPNTPAERTMGSEVNVLNSLFLFETVKSNCTFRAFNRNPGYLPNKHGHFGRCPFWRESFWWSHDAFTNTNAINMQTNNNYRTDWMKFENTNCISK